MSNRYLKRRTYNPVRERGQRTEESAREPRSFPVDLRLIFNKTIFEVCVLCMLIGAIGMFLFSHEYFQVRDIHVSGLDAYATEKVSGAVKEELNKKLVSLKRDTYLLVNEPKVSDAVHRVIAADAVTVSKRFPHSLVISATERPIAAHVTAQNGVAYVAPDGKLVRWYDGEGQGAHIASVPIIRVSKEVTDKNLFAEIIPADDVQKVTKIFGLMRSLENFKLQVIGYGETSSDSITLEYENGRSVAIKLSADIDIQIKKVMLSIEKYPTAKKIDVRFGDKVFVTF